MWTERDRLLAAIRNHPFPPQSQHPFLLFSAADVPSLRQRAASHPGLIERAVGKARRHLETPGKTVNELQPYVSGYAAVDVAAACVLADLPQALPWLHDRVLGLLAMKTWFSPVHVGGCRVCDHVMANLAAEVTLVQDMVPAAFTPEEVSETARQLRRLILEPFLDGTTGQLEWWFRPGTASNWKIMTCGESGLAFCSYAEHWPEAPEAMARAAQGVIDVLDLVPPEGDWGEGIGYWFHTLWMGLRYAHALRRRSAGAIDLFAHPALKVTGDFLVMLTTPSGGVYNFADGDPALSELMTETLIMLAAAHQRTDWMWLARKLPAASPLYLACDNPAVPSDPPSRRCIAFPSTGAATLRTGWGPKDFFAGLKAGPSTVGHSHLDANSFVLEGGGRPLIVENPYWPQAHFLGFFDPSNRRWNFDGPATVGHSTLLVDGQGQTWGPDFPGRLGPVEDHGRWLRAQGDASLCYPGLLTKFVRTLVMLPPNRLVIRDVVECDGERHAEWLLHYAGSIRSDGIVSVVENEGVRLAVTPLLPNRRMGWRWNDVTRTSVYECSDTRQDVTRAVRYRSFAPFQAAARFEFLFGLCLDGNGASDWTFEETTPVWQLGIPGLPHAVRPSADGLEVVS